jgi:hypothetical protein
LRKAALDLVAGYFRGRPVSKPCGRARARARAARSLYERYGFEQTGEIVFDDEVLLRLTL